MLAGFEPSPNQLPVLQKSPARGFGARRDKGAASGGGKKTRRATRLT